ncbi:hypothetical protein ACO2Q2_03515 [Dyella sp. KRB-257]|uniref:hypothetical protein n=1 Tax=Dyella sp. KRB-257 TaxID=3400915 RepID=UPI003C10534F
MKASPLLPIFVASLLALPAAAQTASPPLNLKLPPSAAPAASSRAAKPATASTAPGVYYGDTSGSTDAGLAAEADTADHCDDATYNDTQVHGSVGMGVVAGNHVSGNYQTGTVNLSKAFGDCDHPTGGMSISIGAGQGHFDRDGRRFGR